MANSALDFSNGVYGILVTNFTCNGSGSQANPTTPAPVSSVYTNPE